MVQETGDTACVALSLGKDSLACWLKLRRFFKRVLPIHFEVLPGLRFVQETVDYLEQFFGQRIHRYVHEGTMAMWNTYTFQPPNRRSYWQGLELYRNLDVDYCWDDLREQYQAPNAWGALGQRVADSLTRRTAIIKHGVLRPKDKTFFPVWDWKLADMLKAYRDEGLKLPVDYRLFNRNFDSVRYRFLKPLWDGGYQDDVERILRWFPLAGAELARRQFYLEERLADSRREDHRRWTEEVGGSPAAGSSAQVGRHGWGLGRVREHIRARAGRAGEGR